MNRKIDYYAMLQVAIDEARSGLAEGGIPVGAALFDRAGNLLGRGATGAFSGMIPPFMERPMRFAMPVANAVIAIR